MPHLSNIIKHNHKLVRTLDQKIGGGGICIAIYILLLLIYDMMLYYWKIKNIVSKDILMP
jgi:hypothetical protein